MCTAINLHGRRNLFGRTLDLECSYGETAVSVPRNFPLEFLHEGRVENHSAIMGIAAVKDGVPLFYDAINEWGLGVAGLNFPNRAVYLQEKRELHNVASFEFIGFILSQCKNLAEARTLLEKINITKDPFSEGLPTTPLHWIIADKSGTLVAEPCETGLKVYENPIEVLSNSPEFPYQLTNLSRYMQVSAAPPENKLCPSVNLTVHSRGMGGIGLPGDFSSESRFARAAFMKSNAFAEDGECEISSFFHVMATLSVPCGCVIAESGQKVMTRYTSCADLEYGDYYFTVYQNRRIQKLSFKQNRLDGNTLAVFPLPDAEDVRALN